MKFSFVELNKQIISCTRCPRLVAFRENVPPVKAFENEPHWRRPLPGFGDHNARLLIFGLAPAIQGGNRTGRIFTGDATSKFLTQALFDVGFANQPYSISADDGLRFIDCYITAAVKCVPPQHRPLPEEFANCSSYFENEFFLLKDLKVVLVLGELTFRAYLRFLKDKGIEMKDARFEHGRRYFVKGCPTLFASYHPSPQNTYTGKLTGEMFVSLLKRIKKEIE